MARGAVENRPRYRLGLENGKLAVMAAADLELGYGGVKAYAAFGYDEVRFCVLLFSATRGELAAVVDANRLGQLRTGAASAVAAKHLARAGARGLGVIGCGWQAEGQVACIRAAVPSSSAWWRTAAHPSGWRRSAPAPAPSRRRARRRPQRRTWSSRSRLTRPGSARRLAACRARSSARWAPTTRARVSSTTSSSSAPRSSAATRSSRRASSQAI